MTIKKATVDQAGCWLDGHLGHYISAETIKIAAFYGWDDLDALRAAEKYCNKDLYMDEPEEADNAEFVYQAADDAVTWMNENVAPEGYSFGFHEGELFLWADEDWSDEPELQHWTPGEPSSGPFKASDA